MMIWKKSKRNAFEAFSDGVKAGYRSGYDDGYQQALSDMEERLTGGKVTIKWEAMTNGKED